MMEWNLAQNMAWVMEWEMAWEWTMVWEWTMIWPWEMTWEQVTLMNMERMMENMEREEDVGDIAEETYSL